MCYATANRGACHLSGHDGSLIGKLMSGITGDTTNTDFAQAGERIFNLEKLFNYRGGFTRADDVVPDRFFEEPLTVGEKKGAVLTRDQFKTMMGEYYTGRDWDLVTTRPNRSKLESLGLGGAEYSF